MNVEDLFDLAREIGEEIARYETQEERTALEDFLRTVQRMCDQGIKEKTAEHKISKELGKDLHKKALKAALNSIGEWLTNLDVC